ncbi:hypothetical protein PFISCL1PPCAC_8470, partial [Pristionchus fissidentatus]
CEISRRSLSTSSIKVELVLRVLPDCAGWHFGGSKVAIEVHCERLSFSLSSSPSSCLTGFSANSSRLASLSPLLNPIVST